MADEQDPKKNNADKFQSETGEAGKKGKKKDDSKPEKGGDAKKGKKKDVSKPEEGGDAKEEKDKVNNSQSEYGGDGDVVTDFIEDVWKVMTPEMLERMRCVLTEDIGLSKKDADQFLQNQREIRKRRICLQKDKRDIRIGIRNQWIKEVSRDIANPIASFLVSVLLSNRSPRSKKIMEKVLERLCELTGEKTTVKKAKTRMQRALVVIADRMATYIDETLTDIEREMYEKYGPVPSIASLKKESVATIISTETYTPSEEDEYDLDKMSETKLERLITKGGKKKVSIVEGNEIFSDEGEVESDEQESDTKKESDIKEESSEIETGEEESEGGSAVEGDEGDESVDEEEDEESGSEVEEAEVEEEEKVEEEEEDEEVDEEGEEEEEEAEEEEAEEEEEESDEGKEEGGEDGIEPEKKDIKSEKKHIDVFELLKEDVERTPKGDGKTDRQKAVKDIIEKRFEVIAKEKHAKSLDSIAMFDIDETASVLANWLEKILPSGDIAPKASIVPPLIKKQGSAFEITADGSEFQVHKLSSTTVAKMVADTKGVDFSIRKKKLPRSMSPLNTKTTKDWADWALEAAQMGDEWGKWLENALETVENHLMKGKDTESSPLESHEDWKKRKDLLEHEALKWRAEEHKIKGEGYLWNKKIEKKNPVEPEKETKLVTY